MSQRTKILRFDPSTQGKFSRVKNKIIRSLKALLRGSRYFDKILAIINNERIKRGIKEMNREELSRSLIALRSGELIKREIKEEIIDACNVLAREIVARKTFDEYKTD
ncbi:MAG: hypothetical protein PHU63_01300 [Candidatus ainarchaeum sp.]|nr:hypothetical protein [Candidatus ainarchaeum sp.]